MSDRAEAIVRACAVGLRAGVMPIMGAFVTSHSVGLVATVDGWLDVAKLQEHESTLAEHYGAEKARKLIDENLAKKLASEMLGVLKST